MTPPGLAERVLRGRVATATATVVAVALALITPAAGCGKPAHRHPVSGSVFFEGRPVEGAGVLFCRDGARPAGAVTDKAGMFVLRTWQARDGAAAGEHVVCVNKFEPGGSAEASPYGEVKNALPARYASPLTSPLRAEITPTGQNQFRFDLER